VLVYPSHYGGSVCGRELSGNPFSSIGFERLHNPMLATATAETFADLLLRDLPTYFASFTTVADGRAEAGTSGSCSPSVTASVLRRELTSAPKPVIG
jgi:hypothetical protein